MSETQEKSQLGFVTTDYLSTDKIRHLNYGNLVLRKMYHDFFAKGVLGSIGIFVGLFVVYLSYGAIKDLLKGGDDDAPVAKRVLSINDLQPPPPMNENQPPPPPPPAYKPPAAPDVGEIKKVKDEEAPRQKTFADQDLIKKATEKGAVGEGDTTGLSSPYVAAAVGSGPVEQESDGDPPDFVAVEKEPAPVNRIIPQYPEMARKAGMEGKVVVKVLVGKDGKPEKAVIIKNPGTDIFDEAATEAAMKSTYTPGVQNGRPVKCWMVLPLKFTLNAK
jgi:periplasmic protein TonB